MAKAKNEEEHASLQTFQPLVEDLNLDMGTLMRFLRARNLDIQKAEAMIRAYATWRKQNVYEPALIGWKPPTEFLLRYEVFRSGFDREGRPVFFILFDNWLPCKQLFDTFTPFDMILFAYKTIMVLYSEIVETEHQQICAIIDHEGLGFTKMFSEIQHWTGVQTLIDVWQIYEANFPETLHKAFIVNAGRAFVWGFNLVKPFMTKHTLSKISIHGFDESKWKPAFRETLPEDSIPTKYGGTAKLTHLYDMVYDGAIQKIMANNNNI